MKQFLVFLLFLLPALSARTQFVAKLQLDEPVEGICDMKEIYALFSMLDGQVEASCPLPEDKIAARLNSEVSFLRENPKHKDKGMVQLLINCKGELVQCKMDTKTKSPQLDEQIVAVFKTLGAWKPGTLNNNAVDSSLLFSFEIKKGKLYFS
jgi:hypothetical protein